MRRAPVLLLSTVVLGEILVGISQEGTQNETEHRGELLAFLTSPRVRVVPVTEVTAELFSGLVRSLGAKGVQFPLHDLWIAASALEHGASLLTLDRRFREIEGLRTGEIPEDFLP
jgi:tRNA(fMet)-specific endonuclease VapC